MVVELKVAPETSGVEDCFDEIGRIKHGYALDTLRVLALFLRQAKILNFRDQDNQVVPALCIPVPQQDGPPLALPVAVIFNPSRYERLDLRPEDNGVEPEVIETPRSRLIIPGR